MVLLVGVAACSSHARSATTETPPPPTSKPADADAELEQHTRDVIVRNRPRLRGCYEEALGTAPDLEGRVTLVIDVGQDGKAAHVFEGRREGLNDEVVRCLARVVKTLPFHDGAARTIRIQVPLAFGRRHE